MNIQPYKFAYCIIIPLVLFVYKRVNSILRAKRIKKTKGHLPFLKDDLCCIHYSCSIALYFSYLAAESSFASLKSCSAYCGNVRFKDA